MNYSNPLTMDDLWMPNASYFNKRAEGIYTAPNKYKRFVISDVVAHNVAGAKWVIDLASGRGAMLPTLMKTKVENVLFTDIDAIAIEELIRRRFAMMTGTSSRGKRGGEDARPVTYAQLRETRFDKLLNKDSRNLTVHTMILDMRTPHAEIMDRIMRFGLSAGVVDAIMCNFAFHYICDTVENISNVLAFVSQALRDGGVFIISVMDGKRVFDLLAPITKGKAWTIMEDTRVKYKIQRNYAADVLAPAGQKINVMLPFSDTMYEEPLANIDEICRIANTFGLRVEIRKSFAEYQSEFARMSRHLSDQLTEDDRSYIELHTILSLRKVS